MIIREFDSDDVKGWIDDAAQKVLDEYDDDACFANIVFDVCNDMVDEWRDYLMLIAYYGPHEACTGVSFDDSAYCQFENDVYTRAKQMLEDGGYDVSDL